MDDDLQVPQTASSGPSAGLGARQLSVGLVRTKSALARSHGMSREQIDAMQRLLPAFTVPDLRRLLDTLRQVSNPIRALAGSVSAVLLCCPLLIQSCP